MRDQCNVEVNASIRVLLNLGAVVLLAGCNAWPRVVRPIDDFSSVHKNIFSQATIRFLSAVPVEGKTSFSEEDVSKEITAAMAGWSLERVKAYVENNGGRCFIQGPLNYSRLSCVIYYSWKTTYLDASDWCRKYGTEEKYRAPCHNGVTIRYGIEFRENKIHSVSHRKILADTDPPIY